MSATAELIELVERLRPTGEIGDGMVAQLHGLARLAREEQQGLSPVVTAVQLGYDLARMGVEVRRK